jgi:hypothetical protein
MPFSSLVNRSSTGNEGTCALPPPRNLAPFRTHYPTIRLSPYPFPQGTFSSACGVIDLVRGYPGHQADRHPGSPFWVIAIGIR